MKVLSYILCAVMLMQTMFIDTSVKVLAEENSIVISEGEVITDFERLSEQESFYYLNKADKPDLESLLERFPKTLEGFVASTNQKITIPVTWYSVGEDYEDEDSYYFQFSPAWDETKYSVVDGYDILREAPYISVFLSDEDAESISVTGRQNETIIFDFLRNEMGLNIAAACGVLSNIYHESSFNPNAVGDKGTSYGICQWHNERWDAMKSWCEKNAFDWTTLAGQLHYLKFELSQNNRNYLWNGRTIYNYISKVPETAEGAYEAGRYWCFYYEVPANRESVSVTRGNLAQNVYWAEYGYVDHEPIGCSEEITAGIGGIQIVGWAFDPDYVDETVVIQVFVGDEHVADVEADQFRPDVNEEFECGEYHGFDTWIPIPIAGRHAITLYAASMSSEKLVTNLGSETAVVLPSIVITDVTVTEVSEDGYTIRCMLEDAEQIDRVQFPTWTEKDGKDDLDPDWENSEQSSGSIQENQVEYRVNRSDHNGEEGLYHTYIYAFDKNGVATCVPAAACIGENALTPIQKVYFENNLYETYVVSENISSNITWTWAKTYAESLGGYLLTIGDQKEQEEIVSILTSEVDGYWIGITDEKEEGNWIWVTDEEVAYQNWAEDNSINKSDMHDYAVVLADGSGWDATENCNDLRKYGFILEIEDCEPEQEVVETVPMHRLYNPNTGEHFYTGSEKERDNLIETGWKYEGIAWNAPVSNGTQVYRLYNPNSGDHHYTMSQDENDMLVEAGWKYEGVSWNSAASDKLPLYRLYNPNADCGSHHYTGSGEERDFLVSVGWKYEGIGWFGE